MFIIFETNKILKYIFIIILIMNQDEYWNFRAKQILYSNDFTELYLKRTPQIIPFKVIYKGKYNKLRNKIKVLKNKRLCLN